MVQTQKEYELMSDGTVILTVWRSEMLEIRENHIGRCRFTC
jgi:hypothetical protein